MVTHSATHFSGALSFSRPPATPTSSVSRPWQLDDREWLIRRFQLDGDRAIAAEIGTSEATVRRARVRFNIAATPGRRRGTRTLRVAVQPQPNGELILNGSLAALQARFSEDQRHRTPPTRETVIARCKAWLDAESNNERYAAEDALLSIASAALLAHEHQVKLRKAA